MHIIKRFAPFAVALVLAQVSHAGFTAWNFDGNLNAATGVGTLEELTPGTPLGTFGTDLINGVSTGVYQFAAGNQSQGLKVLHGSGPNGGGSYVNQYTVMYDIKWTGDGWSSLLNTNEANANDGDLFRRALADGGGMGISGQYDGTLNSNQWYRVVATFDLGTASLKKYIDGNLAFAQTLGDGLDGRWSLYSTNDSTPWFLIMADNDGDTTPGMLSSFGFEDRAWSEAEVLALGGPTAAGVPEPATMIALGLAGAALLRRRARKA